MRRLRIRHEPHAGQARETQERFFSEWDQIVSGAVTSRVGAWPEPTTNLALSPSSVRRHRHGWADDRGANPVRDGLPRLRRSRHEVQALMGLTGLRQLPKSVRAALHEGEEPLTWQPVDLAWGESRIGRTEPPRVIEGFDLNLVSAVASGPLIVDPGLFERWTGGVSLTGHAHSHAARLGRALQMTSNGRLAVTTSRTLLFDQGEATFGTDTSGARTWDAKTTELWSIDRTAVIAATRQGRPFMTGRLVITFVDASSVALMCGMFSPRGAARIRDALFPPS